MTGRVVPLKNVSDNVFAKGMMGDGFAIEPNSNEVYSPITGKVTMIAKTKHAIGLTSENGTEVLLHFGIDTVELKGEPFSINVDVDDHVVENQLLAKMNLDMIYALRKDPTVMVVLTQKDRQLDKKQFGNLSNGRVIGNVIHS